MRHPLLRKQFPRANVVTPCRLGTLQRRIIFLLTGECNCRLPAGSERIRSDNDGLTPRPS